MSRLNTTGFTKDQQILRDAAISRIWDQGYCPNEDFWREWMKTDLYKNGNSIHFTDKKKVMNRRCKLINQGRLKKYDSFQCTKGECTKTFESYPDLAHHYKQCPGDKYLNATIRQNEKNKRERHEQAAKFGKMPFEAILIQDIKIDDVDDEDNIYLTEKVGNHLVFDDDKVYLNGEIIQIINGKKYIETLTQMLVINPHFNEIFNAQKVMKLPSNASWPYKDDIIESNTDSIVPDEYVNLHQSYNGLPVIVTVHIDEDHTSYTRKVDIQKDLDLAIVGRCNILDFRICFRTMIDGKDNKQNWCINIPKMRNAMDRELDINWLEWNERMSTIILMIKNSIEQNDGFLFKDIFRNKRVAVMYAGQSSGNLKKNSIHSVDHPLVSINYLQCADLLTSTDPNYIDFRKHIGVWGNCIDPDRMTGLSSIEMEMDRVGLKRFARQWPLGQIPIYTPTIIELEVIFPVNGYDDDYNKVFDDGWNAISNNILTHTFTSIEENDGYSFNENDAYKFQFGLKPWLLWYEFFNNLTSIVLFKGYNGEEYTGNYNVKQMKRIHAYNTTFNRSLNFRFKLTLQLS